LAADFRTFPWTGRGFRAVSIPRGLESAGRRGSAAGNLQARTAFAAAATLTDGLIDAGRWTSSRARGLLDDIWACGPGAVMLEAVAA
jgi:hypothetical protein